MSSSNFLTIVMILLTGSTLTLSKGNLRARCEGQDLSPCYCASGFNNYVVCKDVALEEVRQVFNRTSLSVVDQLDLYLLPSENTISIDIFGDQKVLTIIVACNSSSHLLKVDQEAFLSIKNYTNSFFIDECDLSQLDFHFLEGFDRLKSLGFGSTPNLQPVLASTLPVLPSLDYLSINMCPDFGQADGRFPTLDHGLYSLYVQSNGWDDATMGRVLEWAVESSSATLQSLYLARNRLTIVPPQVASLSKITYLWFHDNADTLVINSNSFNFGLPLQVLDLTKSNVATIQSGAFQGNYSIATIDLRNNKLTRFDEDVFYPVLEQMSRTGSYVNAYDNPINCDGAEVCHLAWLVRDHPELLQVGHAYGMCSNGTDFKDLIPEGFEICK